MTVKIIATLLFLLIGIASSINSWLDQPNRNGPEEPFRFDARMLRDANLWTKVTAEPYRISSALDLLCARPSASDYDRQRKQNPHEATAITVYVNAVGRSAMFTQESPSFPQGSVIVKQKDDRFTERKIPLLYTLMRKREAGYNPTVGDWEFSVVNGDGSTVEATGKLDNCQGCHIKKPDSDFVFRPYVEFK